MARIFVGVGDHFGCAYYRGIVPYRALAERGHEVLLTNYITDNRINEFDCFVFMRQTSNVALEYMAKVKWAGKTLVYDIDDLLHQLPAWNPHRNAYQGDALARLEHIFRIADIVTVSTPPLREHYLRFNPKVEVIPNAISASDFGPVEKHRNQGIVIGWAGSGTHDADMQTVIKPLTKILKKYPQVSLSFLGCDFRPLFDPVYRSRIEYTEPTFKPSSPGSTYGKECSVYEYYRVLKSLNFDIAIAPLKKHIFNESKSDLKLLEYGLLGVPIVASNVGPYRRFHDKHGSVSVCEDRDWVKELSALIEDELLRSGLGEINKDLVLAEYTPKHSADRLQQVLNLPTGNSSYAEDIVV